MQVGGQGVHRENGVIDRRLTPHHLDAGRPGFVVNLVDESQDDKRPGDRHHHLDQRESSAPLGPARRAFPG